MSAAMNRSLFGRIARMLPGAALLANYRRAWPSRDQYAGIALSAVLVPVAAEPVTDIDVSAADRRVALHDELAERGIAMNFAEMKGPVKDRLRAYGLFDVFGAASFFPTVTDALARHVRRPRTTCAYLQACVALAPLAQDAQDDTVDHRHTNRCDNRHIARPARGCRRFRP